MSQNWSVVVVNRRLRALTEGIGVNAHELNDCGDRSIEQLGATSPAAVICCGVGNEYKPVAAIGGGVTQDGVDAHVGGRDCGHREERRSSSSSERQFTIQEYGLDPGGSARPGADDPHDM